MRMKEELRWMHNLEVVSSIEVDIDNNLGITY